MTVALFRLIESADGSIVIDDLETSKLGLYDLRERITIIPQVNYNIVTPHKGALLHYIDVIMGAVASQITSLTIVYSNIYSDADQRQHQSCTSLAFVWGIHRGPVNSPHQWPVKRKMVPFDDVIMGNDKSHCCGHSQIYSHS